MRRTRFVFLLVTLVAALTVAPTMASATTVTLAKKASGEPLKVGSDINGITSNFKIWHTFNQFTCSSPAFLADLTKNQSTSVTAKGLSGQGAKYCYWSGWGTVENFIPKFNVPGEIEFFANGTGKLPIEFTWDGWAIGQYCVVVGTLPFNWENNTGASGSLSVKASGVLPGGPNCSNFDISADFTVTDEGKQPVKVVVTP